MKPQPAPHRKCQPVGVRRMLLFDLYLFEGALNSLGVALIDYNHQWSDGERTIYEQAIEIIRASATTTSSADCMGSDLSVSGIFPSPTQWSEWPLHSVQSYMQSVLLGYSPWRVLLLLGRLLASTLARCSLVFCSYLCVGEMRERLISLSNVV